MAEAAAGKTMGVGRIIWITLVTNAFPGFGQALFSRRVAIAWLLAMVAAGASMLFTVYGMFALFAVWAGNLGDVLVRLIRGRRRALPHPAWNAPIAILVANVVLMGALKTQLQSFKHPSSSMSPTIDVGDRTMVNKLSTSAERGDIIVFRQPCQRGRLYVKRVVAVAGDTVEVRCQRLILNGKVMLMELVSHEGSYEDFDGRDTLRRTASQYHQTIEGHAFDTFQTYPNITNVHDFPDEQGSLPSCEQDGLESNPDQAAGTIVQTPSNNPEDACAPTSHFVVPPDSLFVMGDNRDNSNDSRYWGVVPTSYVVGRVVGIFWPLGRLRNF